MSITKGTFKDGHTGWRVREYPKADFAFTGYEVIYSDDGECVAEFVANEDDAKLIAAAPQLLEGCRRMEDFVRRCLTLEGKLSQKEIDFICKPATDAIEAATKQEK